ncbi:type I-E CRISPR-associated protein Cas6/Cse3/CasE [Modicisalibacter sp. 'Wilcox']|uniref:type I-E CRISPR-associated protein Cas6/Cse3/CasE n=1 Tax=Modicisalibacter sp. 'Wilcox' TaxID=2679914 RepID=UPI00079227C0|nr:type I-E CRISPR-associated protein Cas6/Cse3/CasE [Modicisalibacter sp. 'Wilcox']KXS38164.1 MAG: CRISPR-associated protein [Halomonadaceae bacterium T82-2]
MTLQLIRLPVDLAELARIAGERGWTGGRRQHFDEGAALHHLLGETFGAGVLQPFRLRVAPRQRQGRLYAYTRHDSAELVETATIAATPEVMTALSLQALETKTMPNAWRAGQRIGFDVRLRPTVRLSSAIEAPSDRTGNRHHGFPKGAEIDAFLAEALRHPQRDTMMHQGRSREAVYRVWLAKRLGDAADLEEARLVSAQRVMAARGGKAREACDIVMHGTLSITDTQRFADLLTRGIGRHRAYGYGMLLLSPPKAATGD